MTKIARLEPATRRDATGHVLNLACLGLGLRAEHQGQCSFRFIGISIVIHMACVLVQLIGILSTFLVSSMSMEHMYRTPIPIPQKSQESLFHQQPIDTP